MHDPRAYITPDVVANLTTLRLAGDGPDRVRVSGVTGSPRTDTLKVNLARLEGYSRELIFTLGWPNVWRKEQQLRGMLNAAWQGLPITRLEIQHMGLDSLYGPIAAPGRSHGANGARCSPPRTRRRSRRLCVARWRWGFPGRRDVGLRHDGRG